MFKNSKLESLVESGNPFDYISLNITGFRRVGFWPTLDVATPRHAILRHFRLPTFVIGLYIVFFVSELVDVYMIWGDIKSVTETLCIAFTILNMTCKMVHFLAKRKQIEKLVGDLEIFGLRLSEEERKYVKNILKGCVRHSRILTVTGWHFVTVTAIIWGVLGFGQISPDGTRKLPLRCWYPFDATITPYYEIACVIQIITLICMAYTYVSFTVFYIVLVVHACGNFEIIKLFLARIRERAVERKRNSKIRSADVLLDNLNEGDAQMIGNVDVEMMPMKELRKSKYFRRAADAIIQMGAISKASGATSEASGATSEASGTTSDASGVTSEASGATSQTSGATNQNSADDLALNSEIAICLAECVQFHQSALRFTRDLNDVYQPVILIQLISSLLIIGQVGFQAIALSTQPIGLMKFASYFGCAIFELMIYCWYRDDLSVQESSVAEAAYNSQWFECPKNVKKSLQIIMSRSQKSGHHQEKSFYTLSCQTCTSVLKNSYSMFTLLMQLSDANN